eukprot:6182168-Pleurochrysis_carterae.AAC.1
MGDAVEPERMQADLPMQSDPAAPTSFKDIANIAVVNERNEWYRAHYAEIDGLFDMLAGLRLVPRPPDLTRILQLRRSRLTGAGKHVASLGGIACNRVTTLSTLSHPLSSTPRCAPSLPSPLSITLTCRAVMQPRPTLRLAGQPTRTRPGGL